ncbi:MAG: hypothetical protein C0412_21770 [Flavobacterium sp.]|nr:hypothetical protein [Flavobacterium sp.]
MVEPSSFINQMNLYKKLCLFQLNEDLKNSEHLSKFISDNKVELSELNIGENIIKYVSICVPEDKKLDEMRGVEGILLGVRNGISEVIQEKGCYKRHKTALEDSIIALEAKLDEYRGKAIDIQIDKPPNFPAYYEKAILRLSISEVKSILFRIKSSLIDQIKSHPSFPNKIVRWIFWILFFIIKYFVKKG